MPISQFQTVLTELIVTQAVDQLQETILPYLTYKLRKRAIDKEDRSDSLSAQMLKDSKKESYEVS